MSGCAQPDGAVGSGIGTDLSGTTRVTSAPIAADTSYIAESVGTGASPHLYVGSAAGLTSISLVSFNAPTLHFQWEVDSARLSVSYQGSIGNGREIEVNLSQINFPWDESAPPSFDSLAYNIVVDTLIGFIKVEDDSNRVTLSLPTSRIDEWLTLIDSSRNDTSYSLPELADTLLTILIGIPLLVNDQTQSLDQMVRFRSRTAIGDSLKPQIMIFMSVSDSIDGAIYPDTLEFFASKDAYVVNIRSIDTLEHLVVGSGANFQTNLRFDLAELWQAQEEFHIVVNRATILLHKVRDVDQILPRLPSILPFKLTDDTGFTYPDSTGEAGFTFIPTAIDSASDTLQINVTSPAAEWVIVAEGAKVSELNFGVSLHSSTQGLDINRSAYYSSSHLDSALHPRLSIYYTELPK